MALNNSNNYKIKTPHAAIVVWNYDDRISADATNLSTINKVNQVLISTVSCISIQTTKNKSSPVGSFRIQLAPTKDWVSTITAGSWCVILMSNSPVTEKQIYNADPHFVKMIGKIESVRVDTSVDNNGARQTQYIMTGSDWGHIFDNVIYIDNLIASVNEPANQGNTIAILLQKYLLGDNNSVQSFAISELLRSLMSIFGATADSMVKAGESINRLAKSVYDFNIPPEMAKYFSFVDSSGTINKKTTQLSKLLTLQMGKLTSDNHYEPSNEAYGFLDPFTLQGTNSFWQVLLDNSNPALNEMYNEISWGKNGPSLTVFNRIKPFCYRTDLNINASANKLKSWFKYVKYHKIDDVTVMSVNAGSNWRDKYNFVEVRPLFQQFEILKNWTAQKNQGWDQAAFNREGFRPLIVGTKQFPVNPLETGKSPFNADYLTAWIELLKEWYFETHRLLNGTLVMRGTTEYIAVGDNIMFDAHLINPTANINSEQSKSKNASYVLAHVESVEHNFTSIDGARTYMTTIQFVRGLLVNEGRNPIGNGSLDKLASSLHSRTKNTKNTFGTSDDNEPDPDKLRGN